MPNTRHRRKKCLVNTLPVCGDCKRLNLECVREATRHLLPTTSSPIANTTSPWDYSRYYDHIELSKRRSAMSFYVTTLSQLWSVSDQNNCFLSGKTPPTATPRQSPGVCQNLTYISIPTNGIGISCIGRCIDRLVSWAFGIPGSVLSPYSSGGPLKVSPVPRTLPLLL